MAERSNKDGNMGFENWILCGFVRWSMKMSEKKLGIFVLRHFVCRFEERDGKDLGREEFLLTER